MWASPSASSAASIPEKGLDLLFRACVKVVGRWNLIVVGTGPAQEELEGLAERLGIAGRVTWLGALPRSGVEDVWSRLDCIVMPSRTTPRWIEVSPRAALDAMAHGVAVVGSAAGAIPETLGDAGSSSPRRTCRRWPRSFSVCTTRRVNAPAWARRGDAG